ncbi:Actin-Like Protein 7A [Manis pentadactyla]|nr:Actin-Like Protein 7A [Manis pentadactyla]
MLSFLWECDRDFLKRKWKSGRGDCGAAGWPSGAARQSSQGLWSHTIYWGSHGPFAAGCLTAAHLQRIAVSEKWK